LLIHHVTPPWPGDPSLGIAHVPIPHDRQRQSFVTGQTVRVAPGQVTEQAG